MGRALTERLPAANVTGMITHVTHIKCPATTVFDLVADIRNEAGWNSDISNVELSTGEPIGEGSQFMVVDKRGQHDTTITVFDRPERLEFFIHDGKMDIDIVVELADAGGETTMTSRFTFKTKGLMRILFPLLQSLIKRDIAKQYKNFVRHCEAQN